MKTILIQDSTPAIEYANELRRKYDNPDEPRVVPKPYKSLIDSLKEQEEKSKQFTNSFSPIDSPLMKFFNDKLEFQPDSYFGYEEKAQPVIQPRPPFRSPKLASLFSPSPEMVYRSPRRRSMTILDELRRTPSPIDRRNSLPIFIDQKKKRRSLRRARSPSY